jgi:uncharacterized protein (DUF1697 family)
METYIALLRGINVSGSKKIKMVDLRQHLQELALHNIQTYIQSGNIIFEFESGKAGHLKGVIREKISEKYGFDVSTRVVTVDEIKYIAEQAPFLKDETKDHNRIFITFLEELPMPGAVEKLKTYASAPEEIVFDQHIIYFYSPGNYARAKLNNNFLEKKLKQETTTRNLKTLNKIISLVTERGK